MRRSWILLFGAIQLGLFVAASGHAVTIGCSLISTTLTPGTPFSVDVVVSNLGGEIVSA